MRGSNIFIVGILLLLVLPVVSLPGFSQDVGAPSWNTDYKEWSYRQEISLPIQTNDSISHYQPIDLRLRFENPCWTENENNTSIRVACWFEETWYDLESQIYSLEPAQRETSLISECNVIFLVPAFADGTEQYFMYYDEAKTSRPNYKDHVSIEDMNYSASPLPEMSAVAKFYGIKEDGYCIYGVGQEGQLLDRSCAQVVVKQKKECREFDIIDSDQIVSFAFSYYYGDKEKDESSSDQVFIDKKIFIDGNLMVEFGIFSESKKKDVQTTAIYRYYYCPIEEKRINVHVKHEMLKDATVQGIDNIDGRFGSLISLKSRSAAVDSLNFGNIYPYLNFYSEKDKIEQYQLNQNPSTKEREWIISYKNDASLGSQAWLCYGYGRKGIANAVLF
ncbi:MAG: carboxypeptidase regulatory-like domain-containing protein, partial [Euryarchaeota archaeon]|nr:carboxypeptidase regulatory-like domain-containing protein [Euryarchaeota archaeon]